MSMISAQCDKLRDAANALQEIIDDFNKVNRGFTYSGIVSTLHYAINGLRSAADTIKSLSDNLSDMVDCRERARALERENQALRDLCANLWPVAKSGVCIERCKLYDECIPNYDENGCILKRQLREFGIKVK